MAKVNVSIFYKNYTEEELEMIKKIITETLKDVDDSNLLEKAGLLASVKYNKYPEIQYYRVNLLLRAGKINKAYNVATNYSKFIPLKEIALELEKKIKELESKRQELISDCVLLFEQLCPEVTIYNANETIKDLVYEEALELKNMLDNISKIDDEEKIINNTKDVNSNHYQYMQYLRIRSLLILGRNEKANNILRSAPKIPLFEPLEKGLILISKRIIDNKEENIAPPNSIKQESNPIEIIEVDIPEIVNEEKDENVEEKQEEQVEEEKKEPVAIQKEEEQEITNTEDENTDLEEKSSYIVAKLLTKLDIDLLSIKEIENSSISDFEKDILTIAFYDKYNYKTGVKVITKKISFYKSQGDLEKVKTLQKIQEKLHSSFRRKIFDLAYYCHHLNSRILIDKIEEIKKEQKEEISKKEENKIETTKVIKNEPKKEKEKPKYVTSDSIKQSTLSISSTAIVNNPKISLQKKSKKTTIKEALYSDIIEVQYELYRQMSNPSRQKDAIKAWDIFDNMISKSIDDKNALNKVTKFLSRIDSSNLSKTQEGIKISGSYKRYMK